MSGPSQQPGASALPGPSTGGAELVAPRRRRRYSLLTRRDKLTLGPDGRDPDVPVHRPHLAADDRLDPACRSRTGEGSPGLTANNIVGLKNYQTLFTSYPFFWPAVAHNVLWLLCLCVHRDPARDLPGGPARSRDARHAHLSERVLHPGRPVAGGRRLHLAAAVHVAGVHQQRPGHDQAGQRHRLARQPEPEHLGRPGGRQLAPRRLRHGPLPGRAQERRPDAARGRRHRRGERPPDLLPGRLPGHAADQRRGHRRDRHRIAARVRHRVHHQSRARTASSCCPS